MNVMKRTFNLIGLVLVLAGCNRYLLSQEELKTKKEYRDLQVAIENWKSAFSLNMHMPDTIPNEILKLKRLNELDIYKPRINQIPRFIGQLKKLQTLIILDARIPGIPKELYSLKKLKWLRLWNLNLSFLPPGIEKMKNLEVLELFANDLRELPAGLSTLNRLREIGIDNNDSLDFYSTFELLAKLPRLTYLNINYYPHDTLPSNLYKLKGLETITLWNVETSKLNLDDTIEKLYQLKRLKRIDLSGTPVNPALKKEYIKKLKNQHNDCEVIWHNL